MIKSLCQNKIVGKEKQSISDLPGGLYRQAVNQDKYLLFIFGNLLLIIATTFVHAAELSMSVVASPTPAVLNKDLSYSVNVFPLRDGDSPAIVNDVILTYGLPPSFVLVSAKAGQGFCNTRGVVECTLGTLNRPVTVTIVVTPTMIGTINSVFNVNGLTEDGQVTSLTEPVEITVNKPAPVQLDFSEATYSAEESQGIVTITVNRSGDSDRAIFVDYTLTDGSANRGLDYEWTQGTLSWGEGDTTPKTFDIKIIDDFENEDEEETVNLILSNPQEATIGQSHAQLIITDNDVSGGVGWSPTTYVVNEGENTVTLTVLRTEGSDGILSVNYSTSDETAKAGEDYEASSGSLTWTNGEVGEKQIVVTLFNDEIPEWEETFKVILTEPTNRGTIGEGQELATITIQDDTNQYDAVKLLTDVALNPTQRAMAQALGRLCQAGSTGEDLQQRCREMIISTRTDPLGVAKALQQVAPEEFAAQGRLSIEAASRQVRNIHTRLMALRSGAIGGLNLKNLDVNINGQSVPLSSDAEFRLHGKPLSRPAGGALSSGAAHAIELNKLGVFVNGHVGLGDKGTTENESGFDFNSLGLTAGVDYRFTDTFILGLALGYSQLETSLYDEGGNIDSTGFNLSIYSTFYQPKEFYLDMLFSYGMNSYENSRNINYVLANTSVNQVANSSHDGDQLIFSFSAGYHLHFGALTLTPTARVDHISANIDEFTENMSNPDAPGAGLALAIENQSVKSLTFAFGAQAALELKPESGTTLIPQISLEWVSEYKNDQRWIKGQFIDDAGGEIFMLQTDEPDTGYANLGLGLALQFDDKTSAFINYERMLNLEDMTNHSLMASVRMEF